MRIWKYLTKIISKKKMDRCEPVVQQVSEPSEVLQVQADRLLHHVEGEFEDEDGDAANGFILADPVPSSFRNSLFTEAEASRSSDNEEVVILPPPPPPQHGRKHKLEEEDASGSTCGNFGAWFMCMLCNHEVALEELALPALSCSCLFCKGCMGTYARSVVTNMASSSSNHGNVRVAGNTDHARVAVRARNCADAAKYSRTNSSKFVDLTNSTSSGEYVACPSLNCSGRFPMAELQILAPESFQRWEEAASKALLQNDEVFVKCPCCEVTIEKVAADLPPGLAPSGVPEFDKTVPFTELDDDGKPLSRRALLHKAVNRFRCTVCNRTFCSACLVSPYHLGRTCEEYNEELKAEKCLYCTKPILGRKPGDMSGSVRALRSELDRLDVDVTWCMMKSELVSVLEVCSRVCSEKDCRTRLSNSCTRSLNCGHRCGGVRCERKCLPCLKEGCKQEQQQQLPAADELCGICMVEELHLAPSIQLQCGHVVHLHCAKAQISGGWPGPVISFGYLCCPQCKKTMKHPSLESSMSGPLKLMAEIKAKAVKRMEMDRGFAKIKSRGEAAIAAEAEKYQFYMCSKCRVPYFGGKRDCGAANMNHQHNPAELVCGGCVAGEEGNCKRGHGKDFIEFKCRYCCNQAAFFCWGTTHFCIGCHETVPPREVKPCSGPSSCPYGGKHPPNGDEFCMGCSMCRCQEQ